MDGGWIKLHRKFLNWEWWCDANTSRLFLYLLLAANHRDKSYKGMTLKAGQLVTGLQKLSAETGLSVQQTRTALNHLKSTSEITTKSTNQGTFVTVCKYDSYQSSGEQAELFATSEVTSEVTGKQQTESKKSNKRTTTNKKEKKNPPPIVPPPLEKEEVTWEVVLKTYNWFKKMYMPERRGAMVIPAKAKTDVRLAMLRKVGIETIENVMDAAFKDEYHKEHDYKWVTLEYCTRDSTISKYA